MAEAILNDVFGRLEWDERDGGWQGEVDWGAGMQVGVSIWQEECDLADVLRFACDGLAWLQSSEAYVRRGIASDMVGVYNSNWLDGDVPLSDDDFVGRIELLHIVFLEDGSLHITYDAGDMFDGQVIDAWVGPNRKYRRCVLVE